MSFRPTQGEMPACRSISTKRRTSPEGAKYRHGRNACLQEHFDDAAHEPHRGEVSKARNPPAHYPLRGDPSTSLRSVFGMTYEADGRFPPASPAIEKSKRRDCRARAALTITTLPPRFARHPPLHREGKKYKISLATSRKNVLHFCGTFARVGQNIEVASLSHVIPNDKSARQKTRALARERSPRLLSPSREIHRFADFAPMGLVRRFVGMLLQAGIPPRVGRNNIKKELTSPFGTLPNRAPAKT